VRDTFYFTFLQYPRTSTRIHESGIYVKSRHSESLHSALRVVVVVAKEISASQLSRTRGTHNKRVVHRIPRARTRAYANAHIARACRNVCDSVWRTHAFYSILIVPSDIDNCIRLHLKVLAAINDVGTLRAHIVADIKEAWTGIYIHIHGWLAHLYVQSDGSSQTTLESNKIFLVTTWLL